MGLNVAGIVRYPGGPLRDDLAHNGPFWFRLETPQPLPSIALTPVATISPGAHVYLVESWLTMEWPGGAMIERVDPVWVGPAPAVSSVLVRAADPQAAGAVTLDSYTPYVSVGTSGVYAPPPARIAPRNCCEPDYQIVVELAVGSMGRFELAGFSVDYRVGPLAFHMFAPAADRFDLVAPG